MEGRGPRRGRSQAGGTLTGRSLHAGDPEYPARLRDLSSPPDPVFLAGPWRHDGPIVAIVGTRDPTEDGIDVTRDLARVLVERGAAIVSGLARGIDAAAHEAALEAGGVSGAVLGTPLERTYPRRHAALQSKLAVSLGLMSEIPPEGHASPNTFAARNRMLAAMADAVVVVQGRHGSGALITAAAALQLGRPVGAVPWDSREPLAEAPHGLIHRGDATLIRGAEDVMCLIRREETPSPDEGLTTSRVPSFDSTTLPLHEAALYRALRDRPRSLDLLAETASLTVPELSIALLALELKGLASREPGGLARRARPRP